MTRHTWKKDVVYPVNPHRQERKLREEIARDMPHPVKGKACFRLVKKTSPRNLSFGSGGALRYNNWTSKAKARITLAPNPMEVKPCRST